MESLTWATTSLTAPRTMAISSTVMAPSLDRAGTALVAGLAIGRGARAGWLMLARGAGSTARSMGRARDIDPGHRRDGIALALLGVAVVVIASSWFDAARPVGGWIDNVLRVLIGSAVLLLPAALIAVAVVLTVQTRTKRYSPFPY